MKLRLPRWSMPLLARELIELSKRRRTYAMRSVCALLAAGLLGFLLIGIQPSSKLIGEGDSIIEVATWCILVIIALVVPASCANSVIREKEQGTLVLLFLTPMGPWRMVLQKWLSQIVVMFSLILTFLPVFALAYAYGGVDSQHLIYKILCLILTVCLYTAAGVAVSCFCRGLVIALMMTYLVLFVQSVVLCMVLDDLIRGTAAVEGWSWLIWTSPIALVWNEDNFNTFSRNPYGISSIWSYLPTIVSIIFYLLLARLFLTKRSSQPGPSRILRIFKGMDRTFEAIDARLGRLYQRELPGDRPVHWRETHRRSFTSPRYLVRILVLPVTTSILVTSYNPIVVYNIVLCAILVVCVIYHATAFVSDRQDQGMEVILTTPMSAKGLIRQKASALSRFRWVMSGWLIALSLVDALGSNMGWVAYDMRSGWALRLPFEMSCAILLPGIVSWFAFGVGLHLRNRLLILLLAFLPLVVWMVGLPLMIQQLGSRTYNISYFSMLTSPLTLMVNMDGLPDFCDRLGPTGAMALGMCYLILNIVLCWRCLGMRQETSQRLMSVRG